MSLGWHFVTVWPDPYGGQRRQTSRPWKVSGRVCGTQSLPVVLQSVLASFSLSRQNEPKDNVDKVTKSTDVTPVPTISSQWGDCCYDTEQETVTSQDLLSFTNEVFSRCPSKDKWKELSISYTQIQDTESLLVTPMMEAGMKEELKNRHAYTKTKELFTFDDGLPEH